MKIGDIYKNKENNSIIQIDSFANPMGKYWEGNDNTLIIFKKIEKHNEDEFGSCPRFNGYGTEEEIEKEYKLLVSQEDLHKYSSWNEIFELVQK